MRERRGRRSAALLAAALGTMSASCGAPTIDDPAHVEPVSPEAPAPHVTRIIDGDTFEITVAGTTERVRLREINTPESGECGADAAAELLRQLTAGGVTLDRRGQGRYGRTLAHVHTPTGLHIQEEIVRAGLAHVATYGEPDEHLDRLLAAESEARLEHRGLYGSELGCGPGASTSERAEPRIVEVDANPDGDDMLEGAGESVLIVGPPHTSLAGWTLKDTSASHRLRFDNAAALSSSGQLRVFTSCGPAADGVLHWCVKGSAVWNNTGDTAFLLDPEGSLVSWLDYAPGASSRQPAR